MIYSQTATGASQVFTFRWQMGAYAGATSLKPQRGWTNNREFSRLDVGPCKGKPWLEKSDGSSVVTVKKSISKKTGKASYTGTPQLKSTQY